MKLVFGKKWSSWTRLACLVVTVALLFFVFRRIDRPAFLASLGRTNVSWFALAFLAYGLALWLVSLRWHLALRLTARAVHVAASYRLLLVGHFFSSILVGAAGGDLAKSVIYARWFRFPLPEVIAAAPLDRVLGLAGTVLLSCGLALLVAANGSLGQLSSLHLPLPSLWLLGTLSLAGLAIIGIVSRRPLGESSWARALRAFRSGGRRLLVSPEVAAPGLLFALGAQVALSSVLALNLRAVTHQPLPWAQMAWTFPAITLVSCLPFTFAGAGVRELAALTFLGTYGVPAGDCVAAALLTFVQKLAWALAGGGVLWQEETIHAKFKDRPLPRTLSIVIPALNEAATLPETIRRARANPEVCEIILVDGGSSDATRAVAEELGCRVLAAPSGRGGQMRAGARQTQGDVVLLLHADTWLPPEAGHAVMNCLRDNTVVAGGFWKRFNHTPFLLLGSRWKCAVRMTIGRRIVGDQGMFIRSQDLEKVGGVPDLPLMEEFELCRRLRKEGRLALADATVVTSARRFMKLGVIRTYLRMWWVTTLYRLGRPAHELLRIYEKE
jgi:rSAM/selenodomain-associated transferase 2